MEQKITDPQILGDSKMRSTSVKPKPKMPLKLLAAAPLICLAAYWFFFTGGVEVSGKAQALEEYEIKTLTGGILKEVKAENAQAVKKGETLFGFENEKLSVELLNAVQEKETLEGELKNLQENAEHLEKKAQSEKVLLENGVIGAIQFEEAELENSKIRMTIAEEKRKLEEVSLKVKALQDEKDALNVTAPLEGIFLGDLAQRKGTYFKEGERLGILFNPNAFYLEAFLPESKARSVKLGDPAHVTFKALSGNYKGTVTEIDERATEEIEKVFKTKHVIRIKIRLEQFPDGLKPGMRGHAVVLKALLSSKPN